MAHMICSYQCTHMEISLSDVSAKKSGFSVYSPQIEATAAEWETKQEEEKLSSFA